MKADFHSLQMPTQNFGFLGARKLRLGARCIVVDRESLGKNLDVFCFCFVFLADSFPIFSCFFSFPFSLTFYFLYLLPLIPFLSTGKVLASALQKTWKWDVEQ